MFENPLEIIEVSRLSELISRLKRVEHAVEREGLYAVGMIAYEAAAAFDPGLSVRDDNSDFPLLWFGLYKQPCHVDLPQPTTDTPPRVDWLPSITEPEYRQAFQRIKEHIRAGDSYQVNYTYRLRAQFAADPWDYFLRLVAAQRHTLGAYLDTGSWAIASASPELYFRLDGETIESRPMKGTAARGLTYELDRQQQEMLRNSEKDRAENVMIVDMVRNDLGRIARLGSVQVPALFAIEKYPTVWQMTSTVKAETEASITDIFRATFPPASITGAPKNRTMQIIAELESSPRRVSTGAIGFIAPGRRAQFNVAIRTLLVDRERGQAEYGVGGGIVWDSECEKEQIECKTKALVLSAAVPAFDLLESLLWTPDAGYHDLGRHVARMAQSAEYFDYPFAEREIRTRLDSLAHALPPVAHKVRLLVSLEGEVRCEAQPLAPPVPGQIPRVTLASEPIDRSNKFLYHKTTNRRVYESTLAAAPGFDDVILYNDAGEITESTIANVIVEIGGKLHTPPVSCGLLAGTYRAELLEQGRVIERVVTIDELQSSDRVFLVNSVRGRYEVTLGSAERPPAAAGISAIVDSSEQISGT
ncbi:MAG: aminodeoxychorismate synthase component I [bacterium]